MSRNEVDEDQNKRIQWDKLFRRLSPYSIIKGLKVLKEYGPRQFLFTMKERFRREEIPYEIWLKKHLPTEEELIEQSHKIFEFMPKISIVVPVYKTPEIFLRQMIDSVLSQTYANLELCIADGSGLGETEESVVEDILKEYSTKDSRLKYKILESNLGISGNTNAAISLAEGEFIGLLDHDDLLTPNALFEVVKALNTDKEIDVVYTDEDKVSMDLKEYFTPHFKPDFNIDLLRTNNYICHFFLVSSNIIQKAGGFRKEFDGSQDYDFILRCCELAGKIHHIPKILYHWRVHKNSVAENPSSKKYAFDAGKRAIEEHLKRVNVNAKVMPTFNLGFYRINYQVEKEAFISILIFNMDKVENLRKCLDSIRSKANYYNYEIVVIEDNSNKEETFNFIKQLENQDNIRVIAWDYVSSLYNFGMSQTKGEFVIIISNQTRVITDNWLRELLGNCQRNEVGITGAKLYYPDDTIQSAGTIVGLNGMMGSPFVKMPRAYSGYFHKASIQQNLSAVTSSCVMIKKEAFNKVGGFNQNLNLEFSLLDLCLRMRKSDYLVSYNPYVELYYYEDKIKDKQKSDRTEIRSENEISFICSEWKDILECGDPYYNINLTLEKSDYSLKAIEIQRSE